ncbi:ZYRO0F16302p [Zygosaccharomyces rouxii]|uniref:ZYRO0F16302p n=2 Tax=Zygosaccharomyces rouxii TaxID=4956 RepID=C5DYW5_ZYGRC|nr:uncharacterized protein ZYRO0F16302g [Zygosaccharomyces rouxii]KAH9201312.1 retrograde transport protein Dsl1 N terminal-domain-containing protein [Zygosaccharomyces rouxii]CAR28976.1 ZYRO0F16302p [Zygosaccharomyces rouxii]
MAAVSGIDDLGLLSKAEILESLGKDPLLVNEKESKSDNKDDTPVDFEGILKRESSLNQELHDLASLRSISGLIMEFKANFELLELENCYYSLQNLRKKLRDTSSLTKQSFSFQQSVFSHVDTMHLQLVGKLYEIISQWFWQVNGDSITFKRLVELGEDSETMEYVPFITFVEQQYYPDGFLDPDLWVIRHMKVGSSQDTVVENLNSILRDYLNSNLMIETIKRFLFAKGGKITWEDLGNTQKLHFKQSGTDKVGERISNILNVVSFLNEGITPHDKHALAEKLGPLLANDLLQSVRSNAYSVLHSSDSPLREEVSLVNEKLKFLSNDTRWNYQSNDVEDLLNDDQVHKNLLLDGVFENYALKIRSIFRDPSFKKLDTVRTKNHGLGRPQITVGNSVKDKNQNEKTNQQQPKPEQKDGKNDDDWDWGEDAGEEDAWDNELAINFEDSAGATPRKARRVSGKSGSDEADGWDKEMEIDLDINEGTPRRLRRFSQKSQKSGKSEKSEGDGWGWDLDINEIEGSSPVKNPQEVRDTNEQKEFNGTSDVQVSQMALTFINIMNELQEAVEKTGKAQFEDHTFQHKLNVLQTLFFAISTRHFQLDWWQLFVDLRYVVQCNSQLTRLHELMSNLLEIYSNSSLKFVIQLVNEQIQQFFDDERHPSWDVTEKKLLPFVRNQIIEPLSTIGGDEGTTYLLQFYNCLYVDCINDRILQWNVISEKNSENLAHLVSIIYDQTEAPKLLNNTEYRQYRDKFVIVGQLLQLHLKEIMAMFYNGDFYLFGTEELIQWLILLFADTPLRQNAIQEIRDIRGASAADD